MQSKLDRYIIEKVREKRIEKGISQEQLAYMLGRKSQGFIAQIESGKYPNKYNFQHINDLSIIFGCSPKDFLPDKPIKENVKERFKQG
jgi:transcriptional regulator with XRE-family HTH domain